MKTVPHAAHIIVTGGIGFIGTNLVRGLNARGYEHITIVDSMTEGQEENLAGSLYSAYIDRDEFLESLLQGNIEKPAVIFHLGACTDTRESDTAFLARVNTDYTKTLFDYCASNDARFIYASSAATYGAGEKGYNDSETDLQPLNSYGRSKHNFDLYALSAPEKPPQWIGLKFFNVYGPYEAHKGSMASMAYHGFNQIMSSGKIRLFKSYRKEYADGDQMRDFIYVADVVDIMLFFFDHADLSGIYNVGTGHARSFRDLANALFLALDRKPQIEFIDMPEGLKDAYQYHTQADVHGLQEAGYTKPFTSLEEGVKAYVQYRLSPKGNRRYS